MTPGVNSSTSGHGQPEGMLNMTLGAGWNASRILPGSLASGVAGLTGCCLAASTALQRSHSLPGVKVSRTASSKGMVREYPAIIRPQANVWAKSHWLPVARSQASSTEVIWRRRST